MPDISSKPQQTKKKNISNRGTSKQAAQETCLVLLAVLIMVAIVVF